MSGYSNGPWGIGPGLELQYGNLVKISGNSPGVYVKYGKKVSHVIYAFVNSSIDIDDIIQELDLVTEIQEPKSIAQLHDNVKENCEELMDFIQNVAPLFQK